MKPSLLIFILYFLLTIGCTNNNNTDNTAVEKIGQMEEAELPKGQFIIEDDPIVSNINSGGESIKAFGKEDNSDGNSTTAIPENKAYDLKKRYKNAMVFHADDTMKIKKAYLATLILGTDQILGSLKEEATEGSKNVSDKEVKMDTDIEIGSKMSARLIDMSGSEKKGFEIEYLGLPGSEEQSINSKRKKVQWQWRLIPLTPGTQELKLSINLIEKDGDAVNLPVRNIPIVIFAEKESIWEMIGSFFKGENIKWILTAVFIPIFIAWLTTRIRFKNDRNRGSNRDEENNKIDSNKK